MISAKVIAHSKAKSHGGEIVTFQLRLPKCLLAELNTHRVFSRNAGSSRAKPTRRILSEVIAQPFTPTTWGANRPGMQADLELEGWRLAAAKVVWKLAARTAAFYAGLLAKIGLHKQHTNRVVESFMYVDVVLTAVVDEGLDNFFSLRLHPDAQPEMMDLAIEMRGALQSSTPRLLALNEWHLPYVLDEEREQHDLEMLKKLSTARCARVSYEPFDGDPSVEKESERHDRLVGARPIHASPTEHQARPLRSKAVKGGNFNGWGQYRQEVEARVAEKIVHKPHAVGTSFAAASLVNASSAPAPAPATATAVAENPQPAPVNIVFLDPEPARAVADEPVEGKGGTFDGGGASGNWDVASDMAKLGAATFNVPVVASVATPAAEAARSEPVCRAEDSYARSYTDSSSSYSSSDSSSSSSDSSSSSSSGD